MRIAVVYVYPQVRMSVYFPLAKRFADTWKAHPPRIDHDLYVVLNGGISAPIDRAPFRDIPGLHFVTHSNIGWDIGAYQRAAEAIPADMMVYLGAPTHFYRDGWLERMADAFVEHSPALFGCWGVVHPACWHIRTTAFWCDPKLLQAYPLEIGNGRGSRYDFEHGPKNSFTVFAEQAGFHPHMATFEGVYPKEKWGEADGGHTRCLVYDQFVNNPGQPQGGLRTRIA